MAALHTINGFPGCCGAMVISNLSGATKESIEAALAGRNSDYGILAATIPSEGADSALKACGFRPVGKYINPSYGSAYHTITLWVRSKPYPEEKKVETLPAPAKKKIVKADKPHAILRPIPKKKLLKRKRTRSPNIIYPV